MEEIDALYEIDEWIRDELHIQITDCERNVKRQRWKRVEPGLLRTVMSRRVLRDVDERHIEKIADAFCESIVRLYVNSVMSGHTPESPASFLEDNVCVAFRGATRMYDDSEFLGFTEDEFDEYTDEYYLFDEWCQWAISDYAVKPLNKLLVELLSCGSPEERLPVISRILCVAHMRGDIASLFVRGGSESLDWLEHAPCSYATI